MKSKDLANYIINLNLDYYILINNLTLQKIMYFVNLFNYKYNGKLLIKDESFEAWEIGYILPSIYEKYSIYCSNDIKIRQPEIKKKLDKRIDDIIIKLSKAEPWKLVEWSYNPKGAWAKTYRDGKGNHRKIGNELIIEELKMYINEEVK